MNYLSNQTLVREGHAGIILPEFADVFDPDQRYPVTDLSQWIDNVFSANTHHFDRREFSAEHILFMPASRRLGIMAVRRSQSVAHNIPVYREFLTTPTAIQPGMPVLLRTYDQYWDYKKVVEYQNEAIHIGDPYNQYKGREAVQSAVRDVLEELGYGTPEEFADAAVPLDQYRKSHGIQWPPTPHHTEAFMIRDYTDIR